MITCLFMLYATSFQAAIVAFFTRATLINKENQAKAVRAITIERFSACSVHKKIKYKESHIKIYINQIFGL